MVLTFEVLRDELIEAVRMSWRLPGGPVGGRATDGPWHLILPQSLADGDFDAWRQAREEEIAKELRNSPRTVPLTSVEVDWMNERLGWLELVPERDRRIVVVALCHIAGASGRVSWKRIRQTLGKNHHWREIAITDRGLGARYSRALSALCMTLNARAETAAA